MLTVSSRPKLSFTKFNDKRDLLDNGDRHIYSERNPKFNMSKALNTQQLWEKQDQHKGDRWRLFGAVFDVVPAKKVLYPGCYVDLAPSFLYSDVTYSDIDKRANAFFSDRDGVGKILSAHGVNPVDRSIRFIHADYNLLDLPDQSFDLLISLYAGFICEPCTRFLQIGGHLLVNPSHGDAAIASIDHQYELAGVVLSQSGDYHVLTSGLDQYLIPKKPIELSPEFIHDHRRGIGYTKSAFAYLFRRIC